MAENSTELVVMSRGTLRALQVALTNLRRGFELGSQARVAINAAMESIAADLARAEQPPVGVQEAAGAGEAETQPAPEPGECPHYYPPQGCAANPDDGCRYWECPETRRGPDPVCALRRANERVESLSRERDEAARERDHLRSELAAASQRAEAAEAKLAGCFRLPPGAEWYWKGPGLRDLTEFADLLRSRDIQATVCIQALRDAIEHGVPGGEGVWVTRDQVRDWKIGAWCFDGILLHRPDKCPFPAVWLEPEKEVSHADA